MSDEFKVQWTVSLPPVAQYAKGHMFNFRGETVDELNAIFDEVLASETLEKAVSVANILCAVETVKTVTENDAPAQQADEGPSNVTAIKTCAHGKRQFKSGTNAKSGKAWEGWFCPERNKSAQCDVVWGD